MNPSILATYIVSWELETVSTYLLTRFPEIIPKSNCSIIFWLDTFGWDPHFDLFTCLSNLSIQSRYTYFLETVSCALGTWYVFLYYYDSVDKKFAMKKYVMKQHVLVFCCMCTF